jgi:hypothetical protein
MPQMAPQPQRFFNPAQANIRGGMGGPGGMGGAQPRWPQQPRGGGGMGGAPHMMHGGQAMQGQFRGGRPSGGPRMSLSGVHQPRPGMVPAPGQMVPMMQPRPGMLPNAAAAAVAAAQAAAQQQMPRPQQFKYTPGVRNPNQVIVALAKMIHLIVWGLI